MSLQRYHILVTGVVQGVGFRPFVYGLARRLELSGWVLNSSNGVEIEVEGPPELLARFLAALREEAPPLAYVEAVTKASIPPVGGVGGFVIQHSVTRPGISLISPDVATCADCLDELLSVSDRRHRYPFTNCTNCGPRFTIIEGLPYDRPLTTMSDFPMCPDCAAEYEDPLDRRFHAQPNACPACGPRVWMSASGGGSVAEGYDGALATAEDPFKAAASLLRLGGTMAIKGLGGFHLACDATNDQAVRWLRRRKARPAKPLAVMVADMDMVRLFCEVCREEEELLRSPAAPIVLLRRRPGADVAFTVGPRNHTLGVMLPYTPLHHVLLREVDRPLVMTSGNHTDEPLAQNNQDAITELSDIADAFLFHNRRVHVRCDDSVWMVNALAGEGLQATPVRRSRGYAPFPVRLHFQAAAPVFGAGAQMKNVFCILRDDQAFLSQYIGELGNLETLEFYRSTVDHFLTTFKASPSILAHDMHPDYLSTRFVKELALRRETVSVAPVQHHHAHIASCLADNQMDGPVIGVALDGTGYGSDGRIWGGEFLVADMRGFERAGHLEYLPLPGGEAAIRRPYRIAIGYLHALLGHVPELPFLEGVSSEERTILKQQVEKGLNSPLTSSCGRLFDAVAALVGIRGVISYEAQAATELEMLANPPEADNAMGRPYRYSIERENGCFLVRLAALLEDIVGDVEAGISPAAISTRFHGTVASIVREMCSSIRDEHNLNQVALSGGCFQNRLLLRLVVAELHGEGFKVLLHRRVPPNDGGIALGQVAVAAHRPAG